MKKHLFTALMAIVAIGGGLSSVNADTYYGPESENPQQVYVCEATENLCSAIEGPIYSSPTTQDEFTLIDKSELSNTERFD